MFMLGLDAEYLKAALGYTILGITIIGTESTMITK
jgi:hypothetical protein